MDYLSSFLGKIAMVILFGSFGIYILLSSKTKFASALCGVAFGISVVLVMQYPPVLKNLSFDITHIVMTLAGYIGGSVSGVMAAIISSFCRLFKGGAGGARGSISLWVFCFLGIWLKTKVAFRLNNIKDIGVVAGVGILIAVIALEIMLIVPPWNVQSMTDLNNTVLPILIFTPLVTLIVYAVFYFIYSKLCQSLFLTSVLDCSPLKIIIFNENGPVWVSASLAKDPGMRKYAANPSLLTSCVDIKQLFREKKVVEAELLTEDRRTISVKLLPAKLPKNNYILIGILSDTTKAKEIARERARLDRLNLVGDMAVNIGHEIRNPMTTVRGFLQLIGQQEILPPKKQYFDLMVEELDKANGIITKFLTFAKDKTIELDKKNLNTIIKDILPLIEAATQGDTTIKMELGSIPDLLLDEKEIRQIIINIVHNGLQAMPKGKCLTIRTSIEGEEVVLSVEDEGEGIAEEILDRIGTPFFTTKEGCTGLGLAMCYSIAARHNARITVDSSPGKTIFSVRFKYAVI